MADDTLWSRVAAEIRAEMARRRITQMDVAREIGKPQTTVSRWISGTTKLDLEQLELLAQALHVSVPELVSWGEMEPASRIQYARVDSNHRPSDYEYASRAARLGWPRLVPLGYPVAGGMARSGLGLVG
jgi:transcriptional regulator with XRE-family HTH domain